MSKGLIRFEKGAHWYDKSAKPQHDADLRVARKQLLYPSVTSIDKDTFPNLFLERWKLNQLVLAASENYRQPHESAEQYANRIYEISVEKAKVASQFGKSIHDCIEKYPATPENSSLLHWWGHFDNWYKNRVQSIVSTEAVVLDHDIAVAGRMDSCMILLDGRKAIVDYKTQDVKVNQKGKKVPAFYDSWPRQLAFYASCEAKREGGLLLPCISLVIDSNPDGIVYEKEWTREELGSSYEEFLHGSWIWFNSRGYWPNGKWSVDSVRNLVSI